jgi:hypothetical protein
MSLRRNRVTEPIQRLSDELDVLEQIAAHGGEIRWSGPTRCPECGAWGIVDRIADGVQHNHCLTCSAAWSYSYKAVALFLDAHDAAPDDGISVVGSGMLLEGLDDEGTHVAREKFVGLNAALRHSRRISIKPDDDPPAPF